MAFVVADRYRTNELSFRPGGYTVVVQKSNGQILEYPRVKFPAAYIRKVAFKPNIIAAYVKE